MYEKIILKIGHLMLDIKKGKKKKKKKAKDSHQNNNSVCN
jgi:hypothetical protein